MIIYKIKRQMVKKGNLKEKVGVPLGVSATRETNSREKLAK